MYDNLETGQNVGLSEVMDMNELLIEKRERAGLTRKQVAESIGVSLSMVEKVEKGTRRASPDLAKKWGKEIGVKETQMFKYFFDNEQDIMSYLESEPSATLPRTG